MKKSFLITMLFCLFAVVANAQDLGLQGYYRYYQDPNPYWIELKVGGEDPRESTEIGLKRNSMVEIQITEPTIGECSFRLDSETAGCQLLSWSGRHAIVSTPNTTPNGRDYSTLHITCGGKYLEVRIYII